MEKAVKNKAQKASGLAELQLIGELIGSVSFGSVTIVIQDGHVVQIEKHEKLRLT